MSWFELALVCAFSVSAADAASKRYVRRGSFGGAMMMRSVLPGLLLLPLVLGREIRWPPVEFWYWVVAALPLELLAEVLYLQALRKDPLYLTLPMLAFTPIFAAVLAYAGLGELLSLTGLGGMALLITGAYALNIERVSADRPVTWLAPLVALGRSTGARLMLSVAAIWSLTAVLCKGAMAYMPAGEFVPLYISLVGLMNLFYWGSRDGSGCLDVLRSPGPTILIASLMSLSFFTHYAALAQVETAYMIAVKRTSILFGIVWGAVWFGEQRHWQHLAAGGIMLAGLLVLAFSLG